MPHVRRFVENLGKVKGGELQIDLLDNSYGVEKIESKALDHAYTIGNSWFFTVLLSIPRLRVIYVNYRICNRLNDILAADNYTLVNMQVVHSYAPRIVNICKKHNVKVLLSPFGSEVLRIGDDARKKLRYAFVNADYVATKEQSSFSDYLITSFGVSSSQFVSYGAGSETISAIIKNKGRWSREEMSEKIGIPFSSYNICCGYNGQKAQRHSEMLEALAYNKDYLPEGYQIIIPLAYGKDKQELSIKLRKLAFDLGLKVVFVMDYMNVEELSCLRLITDLFIHVQTTDAANASLQEFILAGAKCINGKWLSYPFLEKEGLPYYQCSTIEKLPMLIKTVLKEKNSKFDVPDSTIDEITNNAYDIVIKKWKDFFVSVE